MNDLMFSRLRQLKLSGVIKTVELRNEQAIKEQMSYMEFLELLLSDEFSNRKDNSNKTAVITTDHPNKANLCNLIPGVLIFAIVVIKLIAPNKLLTPDKCKAKIAKSTLGPL